MSEEASIVIRTSFRRVVQREQYEPTEMVVAIEETYPGTLSAEEIQKQAEQLAAHCKSRVFTELGLDFSQDEETGVIMESFPDTNVVQMGRRPIEGVRPGEESFDPPAQTMAPDTSHGPAQSDWEYPWNLVAENPKDWWDNSQGKKNPKAPDFRHSTLTQPDSDFKVAVWLSDMPAGFPIQDLQPLMKRSQR